MEILVFKTNIQYKKQVKPFKTTLDRLGKWNFDFEDVDNIFRIETTSNCSKIIEHIFNEYGYECSELN